MRSSLRQVSSRKRYFFDVVVANKSQRRVFSSTIHHRRASPSPVVEIRECDLKVGEAANFWKEAAGMAELRRTMLPLRFFSRPKTGGRLHVATHAYYYQGGLEERDARRHALDGSPEWQNYQYRTNDFAMEQRSNIYVEAPFVRDQVFPQVKGLVHNPDTTATTSDTIHGDNSHDAAVLELRRYQLQLGYDTVPKFLDLYTSGLPSKLGAPGTDPSTSLITVLYTEIGQLNEVWEIWYHGNGHAAMDTSRRAARQATEWKDAISAIAPLAISFHTTIHRPTAFSPLR